MFTGLFGWLRTRARDAIIAGAQDAINELSASRVEESTPEPLRLVYRAPETPADVEEEDAPPVNGTARRRKAGV